MIVLPAKDRMKLTDTRLTFKPMHYPFAYEAWLRHEQAHWLHLEVVMNEDIRDWREKVTEGEKNFLTNLFRFFTQADLDVASAYTDNYIPLFKQPEVKMMLLGFAAREALHVAAYSHLVETLGMPDAIYEEFLEYKEMKEKHEYTSSFSPSSDPREIAKQIAVFSAFTEGMQLFSSFAILLNFPRHGKLRGMGQIVSWSASDEACHTESMIQLLRQFITENPKVWDKQLKQEIYDICAKMVDLEDKFIDSCFVYGELENLTSDEVKQYIRYIADRRLISLGLKGLYKVKKNPIPWVEEMMNAPTHGNFFENRVSSYAKGALSGSWDDVWAKK